MQGYAPASRDEEFTQAWERCGLIGAAALRNASGRAFCREKATDWRLGGQWCSTDDVQQLNTSPAPLTDCSPKWPWQPSRVCSQPRHAHPSARRTAICGAKEKLAATKRYSANERIIVVWRLAFLLPSAILRSKKRKIG